LGNQEILVDTSIIIDYLRKTNKESTLLYNIIGKKRLFISSISIYELYCGATDKRKITDIKLILSFFEKLPFGVKCARISSDIYHNLKKKNELIEIRDIFIASTGLYKKLPILTLNIDHFKRIENLEIINLKEVF